MSKREAEKEKSSLSVNEVLFMLCRHKWKIICCTCVGFAAAAVASMVVQPLYKSEAKLFVPYIVERTPVDSPTEAIATSRANDAIINSEMAILTSWGLAVETAKEIKYQDLALSTDDDPVNVQIIRGIVERIEVAAAKGMNVITVSFKDQEPHVATRFLQELLKKYREKHLDVHRFPEALDVITQRRDEVRSQLEQAEAELRRLKENVQFLSVADTPETLGAAIVRSQEALNKAEADRRGQKSRVETLEALLLGETAGSASGRPASSHESEEYRSLLERLSQSRERESQILLTYSRESRMAQLARKQIDELEARRQSIEKRYPEFVAAAPLPAGLSQELQPNLVAEKARLAAMDATVEMLSVQLDALRKKGEEFAAIAPQIARLDRDKELLELNYKNIEASLGKAKDDKAVDWSKIPNISSVQEPSPAIKVTDPLKKKILLALAGGGLVFGIAWAFLIEKVLDTSIRRAAELTGRLQMPLLISIPLFRKSKGLLCDSRPAERGARLAPEAEPSASLGLSVDHCIRPYCEAIRDRLILSFELRCLNHKPKLIGVTGFSTGAGASTLAVGVAAALSETGDGKVLLVDMNVRDGELHPFFGGKAAAPLSSILEQSGVATSRSENLYLATVSDGAAKHAPIGLKRFYSLVPRLKNADFDYIIFDMPPLGTTGFSVGMASFMDKVLLVLEAERCGRDTVKGLYSEVVDARADVSCIFNKVRSYGPKWVETGV